MTTLRFPLRPLAVGALALLFAAFLVVAAASTAHAQLPELPGDPTDPAPDPTDPAPDPTDPVPDPTDPAPDPGLLDLGDLLDPDQLLELEELLGVGDLLDLEDLSLDELLGLLDLLDAEDPTPPADDPDAVVVTDPPAPGASPTPAAAPQVTQRPVGGVAAGAGGASEHAGATWPLLALSALTMAGTAATLRTRRGDA